MSIESIMGEDIEKVLKNLSKEKKENLIHEIEKSRLFSISPWKIFGLTIGRWINVKNPEEGHPMNFFGDYLPIGFIGINAELLNLFESSLDYYHSELRKICYKVENPEWSKFL